MGENRLLRNSFVYLLILVAALALFYQYTQGPQQNESLTYSDVIDKALAGEVTRIEQTAGDNELKVTFEDDTTATVLKSNPSVDIEEVLREAASARSERILLENPQATTEAAQVLDVVAGIEIDNTQAPALGGILATALTFLLPTLLLIGFLVFFMRQAQGSNNQAMSFGKSKARMFTGDKPTVTFADVAGQEEAKQDLTEVVEFLKFPEKFAQLGARIPRGVLMVGPPGTGKCIVGDSLVLTQKGLMEIQDIPKYFWVDPTTNEVAGAYLPTLDVNTVEDTTRAASHWYQLGKQPTLKVTVKQGMTLEGTYEHPVVVMSDKGVIEFRRLDQLQVGDQVAIKFDTQIYGTLQEVDTEKAYLMGLLTGDGNLSSSNRIGLTTIDVELADFFHNHVRERYGNDQHIGLATDGITHTVTSWKVKKDLYKAGMSALLAHDKAIPSSIMQAPKEVIIAFLQGLFDADGYFQRYAFGYSTVSKQLADQVVALMLNFGIVPKLRIKNEVDSTHPNRVYEIVVSGSGLVIFARDIGFRLERKQIQLSQYIDNNDVGNNTNVDVFPSIANTVEACWRELSAKGMSNSRLANIVDKTRSRGRISRQSLQEMVEALNTAECTHPQLNYLTQLSTANIFLSPVAAIERGEANVYDFTVPEVHSFVSNGFISHNTLLSRAVAGEAGVPFFSISGSEFVEMFVGVGASRVRDLFDQAKRNAPCIVFIDEIDAVGRQRGAGLGGSHDEREQTLNQILVEMDGFDTNTNVIVIAATNRPDVLDPALVRPGRFDRQVVLDAPDLRGRIEVLKVHTKGKPLSEDVNLEAIAKLTPGSSGADLANIVNEAAILAARRSKKRIGMSEMNDATERIMLGGPERRSRLMTPKAKELTAYHEAGHAVVAKAMPSANPVHKVTIIPRGMAGGYTLMIPEDDQHYMSVSQFEAQIAIALGGRVAEEIVLGDFTTGASGDIQQITRMARAMVTRYGMSDQLGPIAFGEKEELVFLGREISEQRNYSDETARLIDKEVRRIVDEGYKRVHLILERNRDVLNQMAEALIEHETLDGEPLKALLDQVTPYQPQNGQYKNQDIPAREA